MNTSSSPSSLIPNYESLSLQFEKPMENGDGRQFLTNPAIYSLPEKPVMFGRVVCLNDRFFVAGPGCRQSAEDLKNAAVTGSVERANRFAKTPAAQLHLCHSQAEALAKLWQLVVEHYQITDAPAQEAKVAARHEWEQSPEGQARLAEVQQWINENTPDNQDSTDYPEHPADEQRD